MISRVMSYDGDVITVDPDIMLVDTPYVALFEDVIVVATMRKTGDVDLCFVWPFLDLKCSPIQNSQDD